MWSQLTAEQKANYGEEYFERALRSLEKYTEKVLVRSSLCITYNSFKCFSATVIYLRSLITGSRFGSNNPVFG